MDTQSKIGFANQSEIQMNFVLPLSRSRGADRAAYTILEKKGFSNIRFKNIVEIAVDKTYFEVKVNSDLQISPSDFVNEQKVFSPLNFFQINQSIQNHLGKKIKIMGFCIGDEIHTVALDVLFNMKGYMHDYGLENYTMLEARNMRSIKDFEKIIEKMNEFEPDVIIAYCPMAEDGSDLNTLKDFIEKMSQEISRSADILKVYLGSQDIDKIKDIGFQKCFRPCTQPSLVANIITNEMIDFSFENDTTQNDQELTSKPDEEE